MRAVNGVCHYRSPPQQGEQLRPLRVEARTTTGGKKHYDRPSGGMGRLHQVHSHLAVANLPRPASPYNAEGGRQKHDEQAHRRSHDPNVRGGEHRGEWKHEVV